MNFDKVKSLMEVHGYRAAIAPIDKVKSMQEGLKQLLTEELQESQISAINEAIQRLNAIPQKWNTVMIAAVPRGGSTLVEKRKHIREIVKNAGFSIADRQNLPLKRLAVQSGLAKYGRNNIAYVSGMGSYLKLAAFVVDIPCETFTWIDSPVMAPMCENCDLCIINCPNGNISKERFIIDHSKSKSCSTCQDCCPMNKDGGRDLVL